MILDTNIVSYYLWPGPEPIIDVYKRHIQGQVLSISFITVGELYWGAEKDGWGARRRAELDNNLQEFSVVPYDNEIARCFGKVRAERRRLGRPIALHDAWIAACAVRHNVPLVSHNARDFQDIPGLTLITERHPQ